MKARTGLNDLLISSKSSDLVQAAEIIRKPGQPLGLIIFNKRKVGIPCLHDIGRPKFVSIEPPLEQLLYHVTRDYTKCVVVVVEYD